ncbi:MAG: 50S ribosomal protein L9 [Parcubacteria group bacterium GW2011_GWB2_40_8]|nr:MAG: 50S ribosomal protein L9 [Parcubacteria group bacterium GW2011_GWF2_40_10]KKR47633.1 MAG: 50S ribosomal protein L9 [Parcubacteria group bacterium GW2011_GWA2_40_143]KKR59998.1 MAG: 50S ribosomal protein L9 [Parcubacteria group bacterium GW2011_GWC2_40_31]KKR75532.1 MAG: 50S ribosomal protein L9 [Parcubacteria group bacterium GW2011_GWB2_40_8]KKR76589.1 MAG: 50S ribosomal protein L9 [Parcubacteria group bacterium GW2011_GWE2_40_8]KKR82719.1 MAG: 50S ribosomal protein L9 [Parcubacteria g
MTLHISKPCAKILNNMKVILLQDVPNVGHKYSIKEVKSGYARNFLLPQKLAQLATESAIKGIEAAKLKAEQERAIHEDLLAKNLESLVNLRVVMEEKANEKGHLFSIVHEDEVAKILKEKHHIEIPAKFIEMDKHIKEVGEHKVKVKDKEFILEIKAL